ncbi:MAG: hypothetical protein JSU63_17060 [Phycisphaerales bacterium]|nr:MAG: hypothetical protein JSU63_17060 [Phycisphaerales bacterium]
MSELLLGDEAVGIAAIDAGISGAFSYPGTPATEILEFIAKRVGSDGSVSARWSANEKVAYEEALGMSFAGKRSIVSMKHVGLNVAADPFINSALTGAHGGLVAVVADDPSMHSSQNEQDSRFYGDFAQIPVFEPSNQQEAYDMTREAFEISEKFGLPIMVRIVTRLAHSRANVTRAEPATVSAEVNIAPEPRDWTLLPVNARRRFRRLLDIQGSLREYSADSPYNKLMLRGPRGILASGLAYNYVLEAIGVDSSYSLMKVGAYPVPVEMVRKLVSHCEYILIVEEGYPFIEARLNGILGIPGKEIRGRQSGDLPADGEMSTDLVRKAMGMPATEASAAATGLPVRPPALCKGCPHCDTFHAIIEATSEVKDRILFSDIGCYTLGALPPYNAVHSCVDMGSSISMALGAAKAGAHPVLCTIGDSTFTHSGMTPLLGAVREDANITVLVLDNATVGMTGGQETFATGDDLLNLIRGLGVDEEHLISFEPVKRNKKEIVAMMRREINHRGLSVLIAKRACVQVMRQSVQLKQDKVATPA